MSCLAREGLSCLNWTVGTICIYKFLALNFIGLFAMTSKPIYWIEISLFVSLGMNSRVAFTTAMRAVGSWTPVSTSRRGTMGPPRTRTGAMEPIIVSNGLTSQWWLRWSRLLVTQITFRFPSTHSLRRVSSTVSGCGTFRKRSPKVWTSGQSKGGGNFHITNPLVSDNRSLVTLLQGSGRLPKSKLHLHLFPSLV